MRTGEDISLKLLKTLFIPIRAIPFMESSIIFQGISEKIGPVSLLVKGYKRPSSKLRGEIDILSVSHVLFYPKSTREVHTVREAKMIENYPNIYKNYNTLQECLKIGKILLHTTPRVSASSFFQLYRGLLKEVNRIDGVCKRSLYFGMLVKLLHLHGVFPKLDECVRCKSKQVAYISLKARGPLCPKCAKAYDDTLPYTPKMAQELFFLLSRDFSEISRFKPSSNTEDLIRQMTEIHITMDDENEVEKGSF